MAKRKGEVIEVFRGTSSGKYVPRDGMIFMRDSWYWRARARNGRIVAVGGEGYKRKEKCIEMASKYGPSVANVGGLLTDTWPVEVIDE